MAADPMPEDEFPAALLNARICFWMCINRDHKNVVWDGDVATCPECGVTSEMTKRYAARVREQVAKEIEVRGRELRMDDEEPISRDEWACYGDAASVARGES